MSSSRVDARLESERISRDEIDSTLQLESIKPECHQWRFNALQNQMNFVLVFFLNQGLLFLLSGVQWTKSVRPERSRYH